VQPCGKALEVIVDNVIPEAADRPIDARSLADQASVVLRISAVNKSNDPRTPIPAAVSDPPALEHEPEAVQETCTGWRLQLCRDLSGELW
jgi:hypothetical protein